MRHFRETPLDPVHLFVQSPCGHILREGVGVKNSKDSLPSAILVVLRIGSEYGDDAALCKANGPAGSHVLPSAHLYPGDRRAVATAWHWLA